MIQPLGQVSKDAEGFKVSFERVYPHNIQAVWEAITHPEKLKIWFTDMEIDFTPGGKIRIWFRDEARTESYGEVVLVEPPHRFQFSWETELISWELSALDAHQTLLKLTHSKIDPFYAVNAPAGFHMLLDQLATALDGRTEPYPFGEEVSTPQQLALQTQYAEAVLPAYPELERYQPLVVERTLNASVERVWRAITDREQMKQWYFDLSAFKPEVGFEFQFPGQGHEGEKYMHLCKILEVVPQRKLMYSWAYEGHEGMSYLSFELTPLGDQTQLKLTHRGLGSFPNTADFARASFQAGWNELIGVLLKNFVELT